MKRNRLTTLLLALSLIVAMSQMSFAQEYSAQGGTYTYNGSDINASKQTSIREQISDKVEPGDSIDIVLTYKNSSDSATDWYLENEVLDTLESSSDMEGGYSYKLTNVGPGGEETVIFDSNEGAVGGGTNDAGQGLKQATNALKDYFFIQELAPGQSGKTVLRVELDGESQINSYENQDAEIEFRYAVEEQTTESNIVYKHVKGVKTGDYTNLLGPLAIMLAALLLLILGLIHLKKDRKDGKDGDRA